MVIYSDHPTSTSTTAVLAPSQHIICVRQPLNWKALFTNFSLRNSIASAMALPRQKPDSTS